MTAPCAARRSSSLGRLGVGPAERRGDVHRPGQRLVEDLGHPSVRVGALRGRGPGDGLGGEQRVREADHPGPDLDHLGLDRRRQRLGRHPRRREQLGRGRAHDSGDQEPGPGRLRQRAQPRVDQPLETRGEGQRVEGTARGARPPAPGPARVRRAGCRRMPRAADAASAGEAAAETVAQQPVHGADAERFHPEDSVRPPARAASTALGAPRRVSSRRTPASSSLRSAKPRAPADVRSSHCTSSIATTSVASSASNRSADRTATPSAARVRDRLAFVVGIGQDEGDLERLRCGAVSRGSTSSAQESSRSPRPARRQLRLGLGGPRREAPGARAARPASIPASHSVDLPMPASPSRSSADRPPRPIRSRTAASSTSRPTISVIVRRSCHGGAARRRGYEQVPPLAGSSGRRTDRGHAEQHAGGGRRRARCGPPTRRRRGSGARQGQPAVRRRAGRRRPAGGAAPRR